MVNDNHSYYYEEVPNSASSQSMEITGIQLSNSKEILTAIYSSQENHALQYSCKNFRYDAQRRNFILE